MLDQISKDYGDIFMVQIGWKRVLVLNSADKIEKAFQMEAFSGRPFMFTMDSILKGGEDAITFIDGKKWQFCRKISIRALNPFIGSEKSIAEVSTHEGLEWLIRKLRETQGTPIDTQDFMLPCTSAILASLCFGVEANPESLYFRRMGELITGVMDSKSIEFLNYFVYLYPFYYKQVNGMYREMKELIRYILDHMEKHRSEIDTNHVTDLASSVEKEIQKISENEKKSVKISDEELRRMITDIYHAGFFTSAENGSWAMLFLAQYPEVQKKLAKEIFKIVGTNTLPSMVEHLEKMPFLRAVFHETLRFGSNTAVALPHQTLSEVEFEGYYVPKGTMVIPNVWAANFDPSRWKNPEKFDPERFLDKNGAFLRSEANKVLNFSTGKRRCVGEGLAIQTVPIIIAGIVQNFEVTLDPSTKGDPRVDCQLNITARPGPHKVIFRPRG